LAKARGARKVVMLAVSAPFHCALMQPAQDDVAKVLGETALADPAIPVAANVSGTLVSSADATRNALIEQVTGTVRWVGCVQSLLGAGAELFFEVGPGKVLTGLMKQIDRSQKCMPVEDVASLEKALAEFSAV